jgi:hypothetical protein
MSIELVIAGLVISGVTYMLGYNLGQHKGRAEGSLAAHMMWGALMKDGMDDEGKVFINLKILNEEELEREYGEK